MWALLFVVWTAWGTLGLEGEGYAPDDTTHAGVLSPSLQMVIHHPEGLRAFLNLRGWRGVGVILPYPDVHVQEAWIAYTPDAFPLSLGAGRRWSPLAGGLMDGFRASLHGSRTELVVLAGRRRAGLLARTFADPHSVEGDVMVTRVTFWPIRELRIAAQYQNDPQGPRVDVAANVHVRRFQLHMESQGDPRKGYVEGTRILVSWTQGDFRVYGGYRYRDPWRLFTQLVLPGWLREDPARYSVPSHRLDGEVLWNPGALGTGVGGAWLWNAGDARPQIWLRGRWKRARARFWLGREWEGTVVGLEMGLEAEWRKHLTWDVHAGWLKSERYTTGVWTARIGGAVTLPRGTLRGELRAWRGPGIDHEIRGYLGLQVPFRFSKGTP